MCHFRTLTILLIFSICNAAGALAETVCDVTISDYLVGGSYEMKLGPSLLQSDKTIRNFEHVVDTDAEIYLDHDNITLKSAKKQVAG